jgi:transcriptional regulator with XRE-family HTH domain
MYIDKKYFGSFLLKKRIRAGVSQTFLAQKLGYGSGQFVSNWERGESSPPLDKLPMLAHILEIPVKDLIDFITIETNEYLKSELLPHSRRIKQKLKQKG